MKRALLSGHMCRGVSEEIKYITAADVERYIRDGWTVTRMTRWHGIQNRYLAVREVESGEKETRKLKD